MSPKTLINVFLHKYLSLYKRFALNTFSSITLSLLFFYPCCFCWLGKKLEIKFQNWFSINPLDIHQEECCRGRGRAAFKIIKTINQTGTKFDSIKKTKRIHHTERRNEAASVRNEQFLTLIMIIPLFSGNTLVGCDKTPFSPLSMDRTISMANVSSLINHTVCTIRIDLQWSYPFKSASHWFELTGRDAYWDR